MLGASRSNTGIALNVAVARDAVIQTLPAGRQNMGSNARDSGGISSFDLKDFGRGLQVSRVFLYGLVMGGHIVFRWRANDEVTGMSLHQGIDIDSPEEQGSHSARWNHHRHKTVIFTGW